MCGIAGLIDFNRLSKYENLVEMTKTLRHRGPDDWGAEMLDSFEAHIGLGHTRLSIIDLSKDGHQPMHYKNWSIVFNGEIYNYKEIKVQLEKEGYKTNLESDTSIILMSFDKWGVQAVKKFIGMFAFTIVNKETKKVFIFRDRSGVKPIYYYWKNDLFLFASELKAFHKHPSFEKQIDNSSLALYFRYGNIPSPYSIFCNTYKVKPGCFIEIDLTSKVIEQTNYWDVIDYYNKPKLKISLEDALVETENLLLSAVNYRMVSDVPVGVFLSGGYDSVAVTTLLQKDRTEKIKTFTIGFQDVKYNEAKYAKEISRFLGTEHNEYYCTSKEAMEIIHGLSYNYDEPFADSSAIPTTLISKIAKNNVSVALSADGGDEVFGGYKKYELVLKNFGNIEKIPKWFRPILRSTLNKINPSNIPLFKNKFTRQYAYEAFAELLASKELSAVQVLNLYSDGILTKKISKLFKIEPTYLITEFDLDNRLNSNNDSLNTIIAIDYKTYLPGDILTKVDRATMSVSLEGREPLLDHRIIEFVAQLPSDFKIRNGVTKYLLKEIVHKYIPKEMIDRPKMGFAVPIKRWLRVDMRYLIEEYLGKDKLVVHNLFNEELIKEVIDRYLAGEDNEFDLIWLLLQFQLWYFRWFDLST
ncbi:MAG: asparagine synthase (glutamine-hydrolyzing) [Saprospiraceae bacterium]|nr:asparagine synthase (glutamine-hydrolyzing) [Saprospiraceae bacterium]